MLIGNNVPAAFTPQELRTGQENEPHGARSVLGWIIWGMVRDREEPCHLSNLQLAREEAGQLQRLENMVRASIDMDFPGRLVDSKKEPSVEDKQFEEIIGTTLKLVGDHYQCDLPFREPACKLEDNRFHAMDRLMSLKKKLRNNPTFNQDYVTFMSSLMEKGYAEKVTDAPEDSRERVGRWYMPHHGIYNPTKPGKIRVVFDCLAKTRGVSLNDVLLPGPILTNKVVDVLLRFRQQPIGLIGDIEGMFFQVRVSERHRDFLRYLWFPEGDTSRPPETYRLKAHPFGAISSPSCASAALRKCATDNEHQEILRKFYVDDYLCASFDATEAIETRKIVKEVCRRGGFNLHKWVSNSKAVNDSIPPEERSKSQQLNIESIDPPQSERALGVFWNTVEDNFGFKVNLKHRPATRRGILSVISSVFDPLELAGPFILPARIMLQRLCKQDLEWDKEIGERETVAWNQWLLNIVKLEQMSIPRSVRPSDFVDVATCQLHAFSDASDEGYGIAIYTRHEDSSGRVFCNLLMGKSRVTPLKKVTTPRMELTAASLSVKFIALITSALELHFNVFYWTDSTSVLRYIANKTTRFHTFVANRITTIQEGSRIEQWRHVPTLKNPADIASRGISPKVDPTLWFHGPAFLWEPESKWPKTDIIKELPAKDPEVKRVHATTLKFHEGSAYLDQWISQFSSWRKLKTTVAWLMRAQGLFKQRQLSRVEPKAAVPSPWTNWRQQAPRSSNMSSRAAPLLSRLILIAAHQRVGHLGASSKITELRRKYWIPRASLLVRSIIARCVPCRRYRGRLQIQKMADLPEERLEPDQPAFTRSGVDYFGPFEIKRGRSVLKRYGLIFTCMASRAVHLEVAQDLSANSCINAVRRFAARRTVKFMRSDNGTYLVGAEREMREDIEKWNQAMIDSSLKQLGIQWEFNCPLASHHGGAWERLIRITRKVLYGVMKEQPIKLDDEGLQTLFCEVEDILNSRPITTTSNSHDDEEALTPNHLLRPDSNKRLPPGIFVKEDLYLMKKWRQVQYLTNVFWRRWSREYLVRL
ncbi:uncharacterized protein LOC117288077 [Asterias rubens]|uniref:uncharacterized protein LOC117288077 n=1 Tax=Asterias rubens TaxID=7604 RepID=UPI001455B78F|nr:uncharacterized protein LOC117288077 [Asterias rubens]